MKHLIPILVSLGAIAQIYADRNLDFAWKYLAPISVALIFWAMSFLLEKLE